MKFPAFFITLQVIIIGGCTWKVASLLRFVDPLSICFWVVSLGTIVLHAILSQKNPGFISSQLDSAGVVSDQQPPANGGLSPEKKTLEIGATQPTLAKPPSSAPTTAVLQKLCRMCNRMQRPRTKHCHQCQKCVLTYDHHCVLFNNCVGEKNRPFFYIYLLIFMAESLISTILIEGEFKLDRLDYGLFVLFGLNLTIFTIVTTIYIFHNYLMVRGLTMTDFFLEGIDQSKIYPWSKGCLFNVGMYWKSAFLHQPANWAL